MKKYEIWRGYYVFDMGYAPTSQPEYVTTIEAEDFKEACLKYELATFPNNQMFYNPNTQCNWWTGCYYPSKEEAQKSFK